MKENKREEVLARILFKVAGDERNPLPLQPYINEIIALFPNDEKLERVREYCEIYKRDKGLAMNILSILNKSREI